ncbi:hypothetical protein B0A55_10176 [Friedmanniomyces simplex]|uniref:SHSP domain-containing protein n=1 Tax=Friedmanniomyces simplex TaxID=329884 RepID=A0A4U0WLE9_9PEZI|nr:hypothetical protein B0A55_10176 [Friedmanniomyces simplex]
MPNNFDYYQQSAPFWDWVASLEDQGNNHPFFARGNQQGQESDNEQQQQPQQQHPNPWANGWAGFPFGPMRHRGRRGSHGRHHPGPHHEHRAPPAPPADHDMSDGSTEKERNPETGPSEPRGPPPPFSDEEPRKRSGSRHRHGSRHGHGHGGRGRGCGRGRGGFGGFGARGGHGPFGHPAFGAMGGLGELVNMFQSQLFGDNTESPNTDNTKTTEAKTDDFKPEVDVFDTADSYVVHISLPGAKKEDVGVNWDAEKSELSIAGVIYRPGDEELLKKLALDERKVGVFERKVRLGSRANPAQVDVDAISAKLEDGVLRVDVPKQDAGYVEIKKVDIE